MISENSSLLEHIINSVSDFIVLVRDGKIVGFNDAFAKLTAEDPTGASAESVFENVFVKTYISEPASDNVSFASEPWGDYRINGTASVVEGTTVLAFRFNEDTPLVSVDDINCDLQSQLRLALNSLLMSVRKYGIEPNGSGMASILHGVCRTLNYSSRISMLLSRDRQLEESFCIDPEQTFREVCSFATTLAAAVGFPIEVVCDCPNGNIRMSKTEFERIALMLLADALGRCNREDGIRFSLLSVNEGEPYAMLTVEDTGSQAKEDQELARAAMARQLSIWHSFEEKNGVKRNVVSIRIPLCDEPVFGSCCAEAEEGIPEIYIALSELLPDDAYASLLQ